MLASVAFDICAFFVLWICFLAGRRWQREYAFQRSVLLGFIGCNIIYTVVSMANFFILYFGREWGALGLNGLMLTKTVAYLCNVIIPVLFVSYLLCVAGIARAKSKMFYMFFFTPYMISMWAVATNPIHHFFFHYAPTYDYFRGPGVYVIFAVALFYVLSGTYFLVRYQKAIDRQRMRGILVAIFMAIFFAVIQLIFKDLRVELFGMTMACLSLLVNVENNMNDLDGFSGCFNRSAFVAMAQRNLYAGSNFNMAAVHFLNFRDAVRSLDEDTKNLMLQQLVKDLQKLDHNLQIYHTNYNTFVLVLVNKDDARFESVLDGLRFLFEERAYTYENLHFEFTVDICTAKVPDQLIDIYEINEFSTVSMESVKPFSIHSEDVIHRIKRENMVENALRSALTNRTLQVYYQPIVDLKTGKTVAAEALTRLYDDALGNIPPSEFIPIAENSSLILDLGSFVLEESCKVLQNDALDGLEYIEINVAPYQLLQTDLADSFLQVTHRYGIQPNRINIEITETAASDDMNSYEKTIQKLSAAGFSFSLDDFGTGYSNLARLFNMKFKNIKIDKSLLWDSAENEVSRKFLESMIQTIHNMDASIIQEGVETKEQLQYVREQGIDSVQGYIFSRPLSVEQFLRYVKQEG